MCRYVCIYACMYVYLINCTYVCMYVCIYVCMCVYLVHGKERDEDEDVELCRECSGNDPRARKPLQDSVEPIPTDLVKALISQELLEGEPLETLFRREMPTGHASCPLTDCTIFIYTVFTIFTMFPCFLLFHHFFVYGVYGIWYRRVDGT